MTNVPTLTPCIPPLHPQGMRKGSDQGVFLDGEVPSESGQVTPDLEVSVARAKREATTKRKREAWARRIAAMTDDERRAEKVRQAEDSRQLWVRLRAAKVEAQRVAEQQAQARAALTDDERSALLAQEAEDEAKRKRQYARRRRAARTPSQKAAEAAREHLRYLARKQARQAGA